VFATYTFRNGTQSLLERRLDYSGHDALAGFEQRWQHSGTRRTILSLSAGPSWLEEHGTSEEGEYSQELLQASVSAVVGHQWSADWEVQFLYRRGNGLRDTSLVSDTASAELRGAAGRRVGFTLSGGYTEGEVTLGLQNQRPLSFGSARVQAALTRHVALFAQYSLYRHGSSQSDTASQIGLRPVHRSRVRIGLDLWAPLRRG
jgi:hypothetical protein